MNSIPNYKILVINFFIMQCLIIVISFINILVDYFVCIAQSLLPIFNITMISFFLKVIAFEIESNVNWESTLSSK